jgi:hypothetical protein
MYTLSGQSIYQPNWGWYQEQMYFPSTRQTNVPILSMRYEKQWSETAYLKMSNAFAIGSQSQSSLEWNKTADPRPDYYRYLPSYVSDPFMRNSLTDWYVQHPDQLQIQFDKLAKTNQASFDKQSFYIVNQQSSSLLLIRGAILYYNALSPSFNFSAGVNYAFDQIHYYNIIKDLLGGSYYYNYNGWINDDGAVDNFQNDITRPDRKIKQGERWGADYTMRAATARPWLQMKRELARTETTFGMGYEMQGLQREGFNKNGLFPGISKSVSDFIFMPSWDLKGQLVYKFSGRLYLRSILFNQWQSPSEESVFINPELHPVISPNMQAEIKNGIDFTLFYRSPYVKYSASVYWKNRQHQSLQKMFYHDAYAAFVYGLVGQMNTLASGVEMTTEVNIFSNFQLSLVTTIEKNNFTSNPVYQLLYVNDLHKLESGMLNLKELPVDNNPSLANALSIQYQPAFSIRFGATMLYAQYRPVAIDYFRRSETVKSRIDAYSWSKLLQASLLPDAGILNAYVSKSFQYKTLKGMQRWFLSLSVRNALNSVVPVIAYEQSRFDYLHFDSSKFAQKFLMNQGVTYTFRIQLQIQ